MEAIEQLRLNGEKSVKENLKVLGKIRGAFFKVFKTKKSRRIFFVGLIALVVPITIFSIINAGKVKADWFDDAYNQRQLVSYTHNTDVSGERRLRVTVDTAALINAGKMQADCDDTFFTTVGGTPLKFTLVSGCNTSSTIYDFVIDNVTNGGNNVYMYYSNPIAHSMTDGTVSSVASLSASGGNLTIGSEEIGPSPSMYLKMDEGYGTTAYDSTSNGNNGSQLTVAASNQTIRQEINIVDHLTTASGDDPSIIQLDTTMYSGTVSYYFEVVGRVTTSGTLTVALERNGTATQDATLSFTETSLTRKRTASAFNPPAGQTEYQINISGGTNPEVKAARIIVIQNIGTNSLTATQSQFEIGNYEVGKSNPTASSAPLNSPKYWKYDSNNWDGTLTFSAEVDYKVAGSSGSVSFTTAGTSNWSAPSFLVGVQVEGWGGGGGGGSQVASMTSDGGGGGGGGAYSRLTSYPITGGSPYSYTVGSEGIGGRAGAGTSGGNTYFINTSTLLALGGRGGVNSTGTPPPGGMGGPASSGVGDFKYSGGQGEIGRDSSTGNGGYGGSSGGTDADGWSGPQTWATRTFPSASAPSGAGNGGNGGAANAVGGNGVNPGGGGGGSGDNTGTIRNGGSGAAGKITFTWDIAATVILQEDDGSFSGWANKVTIVDAGTATSATRTRVTFTPTTGRNYRIISYIGQSHSTYDIYSAKIIVDQTSATAIQKLETKYLIANTSLSSGTALQNFDTYFDLTETSYLTETYYHEANAASGSASTIKLQQDPNGSPADISNSTLSPTNRAITTAISAPATAQTIDVIATTNNNNVYASGILGIISVNSAAGGGSPFPDWATSDEYCISNKCLHFNGTSQMAMVSDSKSINFGSKLNSGFTIQTWIRPNSLGSSNNGRIFTKGSNNYLSLSAGSSSQLASLSAKIDLGTTDATLDVTDALTLNQWHLVSLTYNNDSDDEISIYVDGVLKGTSTNGVGSPSTETNTLYLGQDNSSLYFYGYMDEFKIYAKERSITEISSDFIKHSPTPHGTNTALGTENLSFISDGLVGYYPLNEESSPAKDFSGNGTSAVWVSGSTAYIGKYGGAIDLNGSSGYVQGIHSDNLTLQGNITLSAWVYRDGTGNANNILSYASSGEASSANAQYSFTINASNYMNITWEVGSGTDVSLSSTSTVSNPSGSWVFYSVTRDTQTNEVRFFENGVQLGATQTFSQVPNGGESSILAIGRNNDTTTDYFDGKLEEIRIYNRVLSSSEIGQLANWAPGPISWWKMDENSGSVVNDASSNGNTGNIQNSAEWAPGRYGTALYLNGTDQYVSTTTAYSNPIGFTIETWFKTNTTTGGKLVGFGTSQTGSSSSSYDRQVYMTNTGLIYFDVASYNVSTSTAYNDNVWHHVAATQSATDGIRLYVDGALVDSDPGTTAENFNGYWRVGYDNLTGEPSAPSSFYFKGYMDDVRIYNYPRTAAQIMKNANADHPAPGSPLGSAIGYWPLDEKYGDTAHNKGSAGSTLDGNLGGATSCPQSGDSTCPSWTTDGKLGGALNFSTAGATDDYVQIPHNVALNPGTGNFTLSAWAKPADTNQYTAIMSKGDGGTGTYEEWGMFICGSDDCGATGQRFTLILLDGTNTRFYITTDDVADGNWHHYVYTIDSANDVITAYVDGVVKPGALRTSGAQFPDISTNTDPMYIGVEDYGSLQSYFNGPIDEVKYYNQVLTPDQVKIEYNLAKIAIWGSTGTDSSSNPSYSSSATYCPPGQGSTCTGPIAEWKFDENGGSTVYDTSGNENHGTWSGTLGDQWAPGKYGSSGNFLDTVNNFVSAGTGPSLQVQTQTFSSWVYLDSQVVGISINIFSRSDTIVSGGYEWGIRNANYDPYLAFAYYDGAVRGWYTDTRPITKNAWTHVAGVWDQTAGTVTFYINGVPGAPISTATNAITHVSGDTARIGYQPQNTYWRGKIDNLLLYNYSRTPAQIAWDYNRSAASFNYKFNECSGNTAYNSAQGPNGTLIGVNLTIYPQSNGNTTVGTCTGSANQMWFGGATGKFNSGLDFDGNDDYAASSSSRLMTQGASETYKNFSFGAWVNPATAATSKTIIHKNNEFRLTTNSSNIPQCEIYSGSWQTAAIATTALPTSTWSHVFCTYDGSNIKVYVNGNLEGTQAETDSVTSTDATALNIGRDSAGSGYFDGIIDEVTIHTTALNATQVKLLFNENSAIRFGH